MRHSAVTSPKARRVSDISEMTHLSPSMSDKNGLLGWPKKNDTDRRIQVDGFKRDPDDVTGIQRIGRSTAWWYDIPIDHDIEISIDGKMIYKTVRVRDIEWDSKIE